LVFFHHDRQRPPTTLQLFYQLEAVSKSLNAHCLKQWMQRKNFGRHGREQLGRVGFGAHVTLKYGGHRRTPIAVATVEY
jgi:hypothetical protein